MSSRLFISDLHLAPERPEMIRLFVHFCEQVAVTSETLYILGDFVEYWLGDDDAATGLQPAFDALRKLADSGCSIYLMHGNRDFLIGEILAKRCGFNLLADPALINLDDETVLLMHGDTLCTDDHDYMHFREMVRNTGFQEEFLARPLSEREQIARSLRETSKQASAQKNPEIMDVNQQAVEDVMRHYTVGLLIHGHTHRPAIHEFNLDGQPCKRIVLGDWYDTGSYLRLDDTGTAELMSFG